MRRGTTPKHRFSLPFKTEIISRVKITYSQCGKTVLEKSEENCTLEESAIVVKLSQEETLKFNADEFVKIQLRVLDTEGESLVSNVIRLEVGEVQNEEVLI